MQGNQNKLLTLGKSENIFPLLSLLFPVSLLWLDMSPLSISPTYLGLQVAVSILLGDKLFSAMCLLSIYAFHWDAILSPLLKEGWCFETEFAKGNTGTSAPTTTFLVGALVKYIYLFRHKKNMKQKNKVKQKKLYLNTTWKPTNSTSATTTTWTSI